jgi:hypothetical protein
VNSTNCNDCGFAFDYYLVTDDVWAAAGLTPRGHCCLACLERRLKRPLTIEDFPVSPINRQAYAAIGKLSLVLEDEQQQFHHWESRRGDPWNLTVSAFAMDVKAQLHIIANCPYFPPEDHRPIEQRRRRLAVEQEIDKLTRSVSKKYPDLPLSKAEYFLHGKARKRFQDLLRELKEMSCVHLVTRDRQRDHAQGPQVSPGAETPRPSGGRQDGMTPAF